MSVSASNWKKILYSLSFASFPQTNYKQKKNSTNVYYAKIYTLSFSFVVTEQTYKPIKVLFIQHRLQVIKIQSRLVDERKTKQKQLYLTEHPLSPFQSNLKIRMPVFSCFASWMANALSMFLKPILKLVFHVHGKFIWLQFSVFKRLLLILADLCVLSVGISSDINN